MARLEIPQREFKVLRGLAGLNESQFGELLSALKKIQPEIKSLDFIPLLAANLPSVDATLLPPVIRTISSLYRMMDNQQIGADEVASRVVETIEFEKPSVFKDLKDNPPTPPLKARLSELLGIGGFLSVIFKASSVMLDQDRNFGGARVLSDIRTVFGDGAQDVKAAMVVHSLNIHYHQDREGKDFYAAMSTSDLRQLKKVIERALEKADTLNAIIQKTGLRLLEEKSEK